MASVSLPDLRMRRPLLSATLIALATSAGAQDTRRALDAKTLAVEGRRPADFVPRGWVLEREIQGNLTADSLPERVLVLVESPNEAREERYRALVIVSPDARGVLRRIVVAPRLVADYHSGGMKSGTAGENIDVSVTARRVLVVKQALGGATTLDFTHRFRLDSATKRFALIGEDVDNGSPANQRTVTSTNYLTRTRVVTTYDDKRPKGFERRARVGGRAEFLEELDYETFSERAERQPLVARAFSFAASLGAARSRDGKWCAVLPDTTLPPGTAVTLVWANPGGAVTATGAIRQWSPGECPKVDETELAGAYPVVLPARASAVAAEQMGVAIAVASSAPWRVGADGIASRGPGRGQSPRIGPRVHLDRGSAPDGLDRSAALGSPALAPVRVSWDGPRGVLHGRGDASPLRPTDVNRC